MLIFRLISACALLAGASFAVGGTAFSQQFDTVEECRNYGRQLTSEIISYGEQISACMRNSKPEIRAEATCEWNDSGPFITERLTAYPRCAPMDARRCEIEIERRAVQETCSAMTQALLDDRRTTDEEVRDNLMGVNAQERRHSEYLEQEHRSAVRLQSIATDPKAILLGAYFNADVITAAGGSSNRGPDEFAYIARTYATELAYETMLAAIRRNVSAPVRTAIDLSLRELFPSYNHKQPLSSEDVERFGRITSGVSKPFLSSDSGIAAIQKSSMRAIADMHRYVLKNGELAYKAFSNKEQNFKDQSIEMNSWVGHYESHLRENDKYLAEQQNSVITTTTTTYTSPSDPCLTEGGFNVCGAITSVLGAIAGANAQTSGSSGYRGSNERRETAPDGY